MRTLASSIGGHAVASVRIGGAWVSRQCRPELLYFSSLPTAPDVPRMGTQILSERETAVSVLQEESQ